MSLESLVTSLSNDDLVSNNNRCVYAFNVKGDVVIKKENLVIKADEAVIRHYVRPDSYAGHKLRVFKDNKLPEQVSDAVYNHVIANYINSELGNLAAISYLLVIDDSNNIFEVSEKVRPISGKDYLELLVNSVNKIKNLGLQPRDVVVSDINEWNNVGYNNGLRFYDFTRWTCTSDLLRELLIRYDPKIVSTSGERLCFDYLVV